MFTLTSNRNLKYKYAKALQVCDLLSNWVHPSQMPAFMSKDKWWLEVSEKKKKKGKKLMKRGILRCSKGWEKFIFWKWECYIYLNLIFSLHPSPYPYITSLIKTYWSWEIFFFILVESDLISKLLGFLEIRSYLLVCIKLSGKLIMKWEW